MRDSVDVDPLSGARRFERGFNNLDSFSSIGAIDQRRSSHFNRVEKGRQLNAQRLFWRKLELPDRAFHRFDFATLGDMTVLEGFDFVLGNVVIAYRRRIFPNNCQLTDFSRPMITCFDRRQNRCTVVVAAVFKNNQRLVIHFASASEKISQHRVHPAWRSSKKKTKQIDEMNAVRERDTGVLPRTFEAAEVCPQHLDFAETVLSNRVPHPDRCRIEPENMHDLQNSSVA